ncbi:MAG: hypothetical protein IPN76_23335 [Saprospiraceae bacterium]|nr:hypothetical protein [Saprospiraceae bacterium]
MKMLIRFVFIVSLFRFTSLTGECQVPSFYLRTGYGYFGNIHQVLSPGFGDVPSYININPAVEGKVKNGSTTWFDFGYKLQTGFTINAGLVFAETKYNYNDGLGFFWDFRQSDSYKIIDLSFGREIKIKSFDINPSLGLVFQHYYVSFADYQVNPGPSPSVAFPTIIDVSNNDLGMSFKTDFEYTFKNSLFVGVRSGIHLIFAFGFENVYFSPLIGMKL